MKASVKHENDGLESVDKRKEGVGEEEEEEDEEEEKDEDSTKENFWDFSRERNIVNFVFI